MSDFDKKALPHYILITIILIGCGVFVSCSENSSKPLYTTSLYDVILKEAHTRINYYGNPSNISHNRNSENESELSATFSLPERDGDFKYEIHVKRTKEVK